MIEVTLSDTDRIENAIKAFRRKVQRSGILRELRQRRYHLKPSLARKLKTAAAQRRRRRKPRLHGD
jgi:small subunit ribosomal protein S21